MGRGGDDKPPRKVVQGLLMVFGVAAVTGLVAIAMPCDRDSFEPAYLVHLDVESRGYVRGALRHANSQNR